MKKRICMFAMAFMLLALTACGGGSGSGEETGSSEEQAAGAETAVLYSGEEGSDFYNTVTIEYTDDEIHKVSDVLIESTAIYTEGNSDITLEERVAELEEWDAEAEDYPGYDVEIEVTDETLTSSVYVDMSEASMEDVFTMWAWWETDKDYLSYEEVYEHFINESGFIEQ